MSKADEFIHEHTRNCSNLLYRDCVGAFDKTVYQSWLTPVQAKEAIEIARKEIYEWLEKNIYMYNGECEGDRKAIIEDLKQAMGDE